MGAFTTFFWILTVGLIAMIPPGYAHEGNPWHVDTSEFKLEAEVRRTNGISLEADKLIRPLFPSRVTAEVSPSGRVRFSWLGTGGDSITHYIIYRAAGDGQFKKIGQVSPIKGNRGRYIFEDAVPASGLYRYAVSAVNQYEKESRLSEEATVSVP